MYSKDAREYAAGIIRQLARMHGVPETQVRADILEAMELCRQDLSPSTRSRWAGFRPAAPEYPVEEFLLWLADRAAEKEEKAAPTGTR